MHFTIYDSPPPLPPPPALPYPPPKKEKQKQLTNVIEKKKKKKKTKKKERLNLILGLAALVNHYVNAINSPGAIPNVQRAWEKFVETKCSEAKQSALQTYDALLTSQLSGELPCDNSQIRSSHNAAFQECEEQFMAEVAGISTKTVEKRMRELKVSHRQ